MKKTLVLSSFRTFHFETREALHALVRAGAQFAEHRLGTDSALDRNVALSRGLANARVYNVNNPSAALDTLLLISDDAVFSPDQAQELISYSREQRVPASARLVLDQAPIELPKTAVNPSRCLLHLHLLALPIALLERLAERCDRFELPAGIFTAFTSSGLHNGNWLGPDHRLCLRLGGVHVLPIDVGRILNTTAYPEPKDTTK